MALLEKEKDMSRYKPLVLKATPLPSAKAAIHKAAKPVASEAVAVTTSPAAIDRTVAAAANARAVAVMTSEHAVGRMGQAVKLLDNDKLSAAEITEMLADMPDGSVEKMLALMRSNNPDLGAGGDSDPAAQVNHGWNAIHAELQAKRAG